MDNLLGLANVPLLWTSQNELLSWSGSRFGHVHAIVFVGLGILCASVAVASVSLNFSDNFETIFDLLHEISTLIKCCSSEWVLFVSDTAAAPTSCTFSPDFLLQQRSSSKSIDSKRNPIDFKSNVSSMTSIVNSCDRLGENNHF